MIYFNNIPEILLPMSLTKGCCLQGSYWT